MKWKINPTGIISSENDKLNLSFKNFKINFPISSIYKADSFSSTISINLKFKPFNISERQISGRNSLKSIIIDVIEWKFPNCDWNNIKKAFSLIEN